MSMQGLSITFEGRLRDRTEVVSFRGTEAVNRLYRIDIDFTTDATDDLLEEVLLERAATLSILDGAGGVVRSFHGIAGAIEARGACAQGRRAYRVRLVPRMSLLKRRRTRRVWTDVTPLDVAAELAKEHGLFVRRRVARELPQRPISVQLDETDYAYLSRLFSEHGLFFTFDHPKQAGGNYLVTSMGAAEVLVISDTPQYYVPIDGGEELHFERVQPGSAMVAREDHVTFFAPRASIRSAGVRVRGHDMRRPTIELRSEALCDPKTGALAAAIPPALDARTVNIFEGSYESAIPVPPRGSTEPTVPFAALQRLEAERTKKRVIEGASYCKRLLPGRTMTLRDHELDFDGKYAIVRVEHEGYSAEVVPQGRAVYQNRFACVPATVALRPRVMAKPHAMQQSGVVVGPKGQEIYTNDLGCVRVRFHWDLSGRPDEQGTVWARVASPWAGAGFGWQGVPRVGCEVLVSFLDGDPDRPVVVGGLYNATHPVPFGLPASATQSGIRTQSSPGGQGHNEIRFEDQRGREILLLQAERDMDVVVGHGHTIQVAGEQNLRIGGDRLERVGGKAQRAVDGSVQDNVAGSLRARVGGSAQRDVQGCDSVQVGCDRKVSVHGDLVEQVSGNRHESIGAAGEKPFVASSYVYGDQVLGASGAVRIKADGGFAIECGDTRLEVTKDGIKLGGKDVTLAGSESTTLKGKGPSLALGEVAELHADKIKLFAKDAWVAIDKDVKLKGAQVKLNCDEEQPVDIDDEAPPPVKKKPLKMKLSDATFTSYGDRKFQLIVDGATYEGQTTKEGIVDKEVPEDAKSIQLVVWIGEFPTGEKRTWTLSSVEMPAASDVKGAQIRLTNLGYHPGAATGTLNDETVKALSAFQSDTGLATSGKLDDATAAALAKAHGS